MEEGGARLAMRPGGCADMGAGVGVGGGNDACVGRKTDPRRGSVLLRPVRRGEEGADRHTRAYTYIPIFTLRAALGPGAGQFGLGLRVRGPWQGGGVGLRGPFLVQAGAAFGGGRGALGEDGNCCGFGRGRLIEPCLALGGAAGGATFYLPIWVRKSARAFPPPWGGPARPGAPPRF